VALRDSKGAPYNLTDRVVQLHAKEMFEYSRLYIVQDAEILDVEQGIVEVQLNEVDARMPGLFLGEFVIYIVEPTPDSSSSEGSSAVAGESSSPSSSGPSSSGVASETPYVGSIESSSAASSVAGSSTVTPTEPNNCQVEAKVRCYIEIQQDLLWDSASWTTITIGEVRLAIRDKCREDNFLLDRVEFDDTEIAYALRRPIDYWNEALPPLRPLYNPSTFPFRYNWMIGIIGELLLLAGLNYERNALRYTAAGLAIDDKDKGNFYIQAGDRYRAEFKDWVKQKKRSINMGNAFGRTSLRSFENHGSRPNSGGTF